MNQQKSLKAALLLTRVLVSQMEELDFDAASAGCEVSDDGHGLRYEDVDLHLIDMTGGALMLLRGMMLDVAEMEDVHPAELARILELTCAVNEALGADEVSPKSNPTWN